MRPVGLSIVMVDHPLNSQEKILTYLSDAMCKTFNISVNI